MLFLNSHEVALAISSLGYKVSKSSRETYKFHWNSVRTEDSTINSNGTIHRWTDGWHGDLIDFYRAINPNLSFKEALEQVGALLKQEITLGENTPRVIEKKEDKPISLSFLNDFILAREENSKEFSLLLEKLLPTVDETKRWEVARAFKLGYIKDSNRILIPHFEIGGAWMTSAKYSPSSSPKIKFSKGRSKTPFNINSLPHYRKNPDKWVFICEGHKDTLNAIACGYNALTPGGAGDKLREQDLPLFEGLKVCIIGDYDAAGQAFNKRIKSQLEGIAKKIKVVDWETVCTVNKIATLKEGFDLTDFLKNLKEKK